MMTREEVKQELTAAFGFLPDTWEIYYDAYCKAMNDDIDNEKEAV